MPQPLDRFDRAHLPLSPEAGLQGALAEVQGGREIADAERLMAVPQDPVLGIAAVLLSSGKANAGPGSDPIPGLQLLDQAVAEGLQ